MDLALRLGMAAPFALLSRVLAVLIAIVTSPPARGASPEIVELAPWRLVPGQTRLLPVDGLDRYSLSGKALRAAPLPQPSPESTLLLKALEPGTAEVWIWKKDGSLLHLSVLVQQPSREGPENEALTRAVGDLREASATIAGERTLLRGMIRSEQELARIHALEDAFPKQVENHTETAAELLGSGRIRLEAWIAEQRLQSSLRVETLGSQLWVRGSAPDLPTRSGWEQKLRSLFAGARLDISTLPESSRTLFFRVFLLEVKKSAFRELGLDWPSHLSGSLKIEGGSLFWAQSPSIDMTLRLLEGKGWARILSQPELVVRVPGEAELFNGGEIPIQVHSKTGHRGGNWVEWKSYGLSLKLRALHSTAEQVRLEISSEMSELDRANGSDSLPALQSSRVRSQVDARIGEPLFLSGLLQEKSGTQERGWPILGSIPLLGRLFGSEDATQSRSELVAVLVPLNAPPPAPQWTRQDPQRETPLPPPHPSPAPEPAGSGRSREWMAPLLARRIR
jgi:pilus assembly protein CpaC